MHVESVHESEERVLRTLEPDAMRVAAILEAAQRAAVPTRHDGELLQERSRSARPLSHGGTVGTCD